MPAAQYTMHPARERTRWEMCLVGHDAPDAFRGVKGGCPVVRSGGPAEGGVGDDFGRRDIDSPSDRRYLLQFYLTGITAITVRWVEGGCAESVEHMVTLISGCIPRA